MPQTVLYDNLPPDAAARDAARRASMDRDEAISAADFEFVTQRVPADIQAAVIAALTEARIEETARLKRVERIAREPWRRAQRLPRSIVDLLDT